MREIFHECAPNLCMLASDPSLFTSYSDSPLKVSPLNFHIYCKMQVYRKVVNGSV